MRLLFAALCFGVLLGCDCGGPVAGDGGAGGGTSNGGGAGGGGAGGGGGSSADAGPSLGEFCAQYPGAICALKVACGQYSDAGFTACVHDQTRMIADYCGRVDAGSILYAPAAAQSCLDATKLSPVVCLVGSFGCGINVVLGVSPFVANARQCGAETCAPSAFCNDDCLTPLCVPGRQVGQSCEEEKRPYALCDKDAGYCRADDGGYGGPTAVCRPFVGLGMFCEFDTCAPGQVCWAGVCETIGGRDAPCTGYGECFDNVCRATDQRCGALDAGSPCIAGEDCGFGADTANFCVGLALAADGGVADAGRCAPRPKHGEPCAYEWTPRSSQPCPAGDACLDGQCRTLTTFTAPVGSECPVRPWGITTAPYLGFAYCQPGLVCLRDPTAHLPKTGHCGPVLQPGEECSDDLDCTTLLCTSRDGGPSTCQWRLGLHAPCGQCFAELTCALNDAGTSWCVPPVANGEDCEVYATCANGYCEYPDWRCKPYATGACTAEYQCESSFCSGGQCVPVGACRAPY